MKLIIVSKKQREVVDITDRIAGLLNNEGGIINIFAKHTTCAVTTADLDPGTDEDFLEFLKNIIPSVNFKHPHKPEHAPDHILSSIIGPSVNVPILNGELQLGTWQRIVLVEFDGPRERELVVTVS